MADGEGEQRYWDSGMTQMLASVASFEEAGLLVPLNIHILDLKDPSRGALGALDTALVRQIVEAYPSQIISATVGDLPMDPDQIAEAVAAMAETGVNFIKIGFFAEHETWPKVLQRLHPIIERGYKLIAVLFADQPIDLDCLKAFDAAGFHGVMVDTADKSRGGLLAHRNSVWLNLFVRTAQDRGLLTGLAGSLAAHDIPELKRIRSDYLGFRGALCSGGRTGSIDLEAVQRIRETVIA